MVDPKEKQQLLNDYIVKFPDVRDREFRMIHDLCETRAKLEELQDLIEELKDVAEEDGE